MKILIADDDAVPRHLLATILERWGYEVVSVADGIDAWRILQGEDAPRVAILDWLMPGLDGLSVCRKVRERAEGAPYTYLILLTSRDSKDDVVAGLDAGADDYLTKPFHRHELQVRLHAGRRILDLEAALLNSLQEVKQAQEQVAQAQMREVETGAKIQQTLLLGQPPQELSKGRVAALTIPSQQIDGDFYEFFLHGDGCLDVIVGDVMGKGVPAALMGAAIKSHLLRALGQLQSTSPESLVPRPQDIVTAVHSELTAQFIGLERFATLCYARFNLNDHVLEWVDCGHTKTIHYHRSSGVCEQLEGGQNMPLGFSESEVYTQLSQSIEPGDVFVFYSDGITEAQDADGEQFGRERLMALVRDNSARTPEELVQALREGVVAFSGSDRFADDLTCVAVQIGDAGGRLAQATLEVKSHLNQLEPLRNFLREFCLHLSPPLDEERLDQLELAVNEAASNIIRHAYEGRHDKTIHVIADAYADRVCIQLRHHGHPFDPNEALPPTFDGTRDGGFGVYIITQCADRVRYLRDEDETNIIELIKNREG